VPLVREAWVLSFRAAASTTGSKSGQAIPFFMLPAAGGGSSLRGFSSWRFRDRNSMEIQAEWRVIVNRYVDMAVFYDTGKVTAHVRDLGFDHLKNDAGLGFRFHGPLSTPLRIDFAKSNEGFSIVWAASAVF
jgi:outer membrane translocation and assembly module TamA